MELLSIPSRAVAREMKMNVVLPDSYQKNALKKYPVVYVLHGHGDNELGWAQKTPLEELVDQYQVIVVCPNGLVTWYFNSYTNPQLNMEDHIIKEVVPYVDKSFRTLASRKGRAITGNSMGGHGALSLGAKHPKVFGALGSMSGGVDFTPFPNNWNIKDNLGPYTENKNRWEKNTVQYLLPKTRKGTYAIMVSCGTEDVFFDVNKKLDAALTKAGIKHEFDVSSGGHNWPYWKECVLRQFAFFDEYFRSTGATKLNKSIGKDIGKSS